MVRKICKMLAVDCKVDLALAECSKQVFYFSGQNLKFWKKIYRTGSSLRMLLIDGKF